MLKRFIASFVCLTFVFSNFQYVHAQDFSINQLPVPGTMVEPSAPFSPLAIKGLIVNPQKPLDFQFLVDTGTASDAILSEAKLTPEPLKQEINQLVKYFLAGLTIPEGDLWVNLSPYEKDRMVPEALGQTGLGRDLLAQDYILKQLTASLIYPEKGLGKEFWNKVYAKAQEQFGTTNVPVDTFNKVWILPNQAQVYETPNAAYVTKATLKVMLDEDYTALIRHSEGVRSTTEESHSVASQIIREIILPEIEKEVNSGKNFAQIRQIFQALILAKWYKEKIQNGLIEAEYNNKNRIAGINLQDPSNKEQIYQRYIQAYKKGVFNFIKEDPVDQTQTTVRLGEVKKTSRKYFSGGTYLKIDNLEISDDGAMISPNEALIVGISLKAAPILILSVVGGFKLKDFIKKQRAKNTLSNLNSKFFGEHVIEGLFILGYYPPDSDFRRYLKDIKWAQLSHFEKKLILMMIINKVYSVNNIARQEYEAYLTILAEDKSRDVRELAVQIVEIIQRAKNESPDDLKGSKIKKLIQRYGQDIHDYIFKEMLKINDLYLFIRLNGMTGPGFVSKLLSKINKYADDPFLLETLLYLSKDFSNNRLSSDNIQKILALFSELPEEQLSDAASSLINQSVPGVIETLIQIMLMSLDGMDDSNKVSRIETIRECANSLATVGRGDFVEPMKRISFSSSVEEIEKTILFTIQPANNFNEPSRIIFDRLARKYLPGYVGETKPVTVKVTKDDAMTHPDQEPVISFNAVEAKNNGGIDLNQIKISSTGKTIVQFDPAQLNAFTQDGDFGGFAPVITSISYIKNPQVLFRK